MFSFMQAMAYSSRQSRGGLQLTFGTASVGIHSGKAALKHYMKVDFKSSFKELRLP